MSWSDQRLNEQDAPDDAGADRRMSWPWIAAGVVAILVALYIGAALFFAGRIPTDTSVAGIDVGGMSEEDAAAAIETELIDVIREPAPVTVAGTDISAEIDPSGTGVEVDGAATVDGLTGLSFDPADLWRHMSGSDELTPVVRFDEEALAEAVDELNERLGTETEDATISFAGSTVQTTPQVNGTGIDVDSAVEVLGSGWLSETRPIELEPVDIHPDVTDEDVARIREQQAEPLVAAPLTVLVDETEVVLEPTMLAEAASFEVLDGELTMTLDEQQLVDHVVAETEDEFRAPRDARLVIDDREVGPEIKPGRKGIVVDRDATGDAIAGAATTETRTVDAVVSEELPEVTTADLEELGIDEVVSEISTPLTDDPVRTENLIVGTSRTDGTLIMPGEEFSLLSVLGPITEENGFVSSGVVMDGFNSVALGGGLSQLSTNTFNIGYWAGMEDIQHQPHSKYFDRYPMGVEATVWVPTVDMRWKNNSPYAVLVESWIEDDQVHSRLWSTDYYDVDVTVSEPYNYRQPGTEVNSAADCVPYPAGNPGFTVDVRRTVERDGEMIYNDSYTWTYQPVHAAVCG